MKRRAFVQLSALGAVGLAVPVSARAVRDSGVSVRVEPLKHRVIVSDSGGERVIGGLGHAPGRFNGPSVAAIGPRGFAVVDQGNYRVQTFGFDGSLKATFGKFGDGPGGFWHLAGIAIANNGEIFVADSLKHRVTRHAPDGTLLATIDGLDHPHSLAMTSDGLLHIGELGRSSHVRVVDASGTTVRVYAAADGKRPYILARLGSRVIPRERPDYVG